MGVEVMSMSSLGGTLRLGYLESQEMAPVLLKSKKVSRNSSRTPSKEVSKASHPRSPPRATSHPPQTPPKTPPKTPPQSPLEWTYEPQREVHVKGNVRHQVSKAANSEPRLHQPHLVSTMRIEPESPPTKPPLVPGRAREQIVVTESDLKRCGGNLKLLRECDMGSEKEVKVEKTLSFKSAFAMRCRSDADLRDPWSGVKNPEDTRDLQENDLILNQVWFKALSPRKLTKDPDAPERKEERAPDMQRAVYRAARSASADLPMIRAGRGGSVPVGSYRVDRPRSKDSRDPSRPPSAQSWEGEQRSVPQRRSSTRRARTHGGGIPRPTGEDAPIKNSKFKSRIQLVDDSHDDDAHAYCGAGSLAVRNASKAQRRFEKEIDELKGPFFVWLSLDAETGEIEIYPKLVAARLEGSYRAGRTNVPLVGLADDLDGTTVFLGDQPIQRTWSGEQRDVKRVEAASFEDEIAVHRTFHEGSWRFAQGPLADLPSEREVVQYWRSDCVQPPSPTLPPVNPDRRPICFINQGADWGNNE